ncbi:hypothetical protein ADUPG1_006470 [Aduncisulcus paluster]|uniref:Uncharacterized protein n=1 Tax=Aduncisulcus paluster TaxID=2918883 RepID=A0ABQ5KID9_9EUKA|nr:hypothetical protein ADUPG1_006470 [Aduncisulcus paluster]
MSPTSVMLRERTSAVYHNQCEHSSEKTGQSSTQSPALPLIVSTLHQAEGRTAVSIQARSPSTPIRIRHPTTQASSPSTWHPTQSRTINVELQQSLHTPDSTPVTSHSSSDTTRETTSSSETASSQYSYFDEYSQEYTSQTSHESVGASLVEKDDNSESQPLELLKFLRAMLANGTGPYDWDLVLPQIQFLMNTQQCSATGFTPFEMVFARDPTKLFDLFTNNVEELEVHLGSKKSKENAAVFMKEHRDLLVYLAKQAKRIQEEVKKELIMDSVEKDQFVWLLPHKKASKLSARMRSPFKVVDPLKCNRVEIRSLIDDDKTLKVHIKRLVPVKGSHSLEELERYSCLYENTWEELKTVKDTIALETHRRKSTLAAWAAHEWTGQEAPYFKESPISQRLFHAFPSFMSTRIHMLTARPTTPTNCPLCHGTNSQNHVLGGGDALMPLYRQQHHDISKALTALIMRYLFKMDP